MYFMQKSFVLLVSSAVFYITLLTMVSGCNQTTSRVKELIELTPKLVAKGNAKIINTPITLNADLDWDISSKTTANVKSYNITPNKIISEPIIHQDMIYVMDDKGYVCAFSIKNRRVIWRESIANIGQHNYEGGGFAYSNGKLYVTNGSRFLITLDSKNGHEISRKLFSDLIRIKPILISEDIILVQTVSNNLIAYNLRTLQITWQHGSLIETITSSSHIPPVVYNNTVLVAYSSGQVFALDASSGKEKWVLDLSGDKESALPNFDIVDVLSNFIVSDNNIYCDSGVGKILNIDLNSGQIKWSTVAHDVNSMHLLGQYLLIANNAKQVAAIDKVTGKVMWTQDLKIKGKKPLQFAKFLTSKSHNTTTLHVITEMGEMHNFNISAVPEFASITRVPTGVKFVKYSCCGIVYLTSNKDITFIQYAPK